MAETLKQVEAIPASYPAVTPYANPTLDSDVLPDADQIWQRIEAYVSYRWTDREVIWTVEGSGDWTPPLTPATFTATEEWSGSAWASVTLDAGPYGLCLPSDGPYRITADVGGGTVPAAVQDAFKRLYEYTKGITGQWRGDAAYMTSHEDTIATNWTGRALQLSGAADLLRNYRRAP